MSATPTPSVDPSVSISEPLGAIISLAGEEALCAYTEGIFGSPVSIRLETDPEFGDRHIVAEAIARGTVAEICARFDEWHRRLRTEFGNKASEYRLALLPE